MIKAIQGLLFERRRVKQDLSLLDCLQFSDKAQIVARNEQLRRLTRIESRRQIEDVGRRLEKLRYNLAHSQDIVAHDRQTIVQLVENLDSVLDGPPGLKIPCELPVPNSVKAECAPACDRNQ